MNFSFKHVHLNVKQNAKMHQCQVQSLNVLNINLLNICVVFYNVNLIFNNKYYNSFQLLFYDRLRAGFSCHFIHQKQSNKRKKQNL